MRAIRLGVFISLVSLLIVSCVGSKNPGDTGYVVMMPYVSEEMGFRSIVPANWETEDGAQYMRRASQIDQTALIQVALPGMSMAEAKIFAATQLGLEALPDSMGTYTSPRLTWDLYEFEPLLSELAKAKMQLAMSEYGEDIYVVLMAALMGDYEAEAPYHGTIFNSAVHSLSPLE